MPDISKTPGSLDRSPPAPAWPPAWRWVGERGLRVATGERTLARYRHLRSCNLPEVEDIIPADGSILIVLRPGAAVSGVRAALAAPLGASVAVDGVLHRIVVRYGGAAGPDLAALADRAGISEAAWIALHAATEHRVDFLGFQPGFPYLSGLPQALRAPRRNEPRIRVAAGSVAVAARFTGIYPSAGPGGWQIVGQTEAVLFDSARPGPALLSPGDRVCFVAA